MKFKGEGCVFAKGGDKVTWNQVLVLVGAELLAPGPILCWSLLERRDLAAGLDGGVIHGVSFVATHVPAALGASPPSLELVPSTSGHGAEIWWPPEGWNHLQNHQRWFGWSGGW